MTGAQTFRLVALVSAALALAATPLGSTAQTAPQEQSPSSQTTPIAELGVELPSFGGAHWFHGTRKYFTPAIMADIRDNLHATYVRTGWTPDERSFEKIRWYREDHDLDTICTSGLRVMVIVPTPHDDPAGQDDLLQDVHDFFERYTLREFGCIAYAEIINEADLPRNGFADVNAYASFFRQVAPIVAQFRVPIITTGTSGMDLPWTTALGTSLRAEPPAPPAAFGFHPYGVAPAAMADATMRMRRAAGGGIDLPTVYVTEIGQDTAAGLYQTIVTLAHATPAITVYEYVAQYNEDPRYALLNNPPLYRAMQKAWATLHQAPQSPQPTAANRRRANS